MSTTWEPMLVPVPDPQSQFFWESGRDGILRMLRCGSCGYWIHPPTPVCPECTSRAVTPQPLSGLGVIHSFTVNHQQWSPDQNVPYVIVLVELAEQPGLRLTSSLVTVPLSAGDAPANPDPSAVTIGMSVEVLFVERSGVFIPVFTALAPRT